jgi:hypothetical protein
MSPFGAPSVACCKSRARPVTRALAGCVPRASRTPPSSCASLVPVTPTTSPSGSAGALALWIVSMMDAHAIGARRPPAAHPLRQRRDRRNDVTLEDSNRVVFASLSRGRWRAPFRMPLLGLEDPVRSSSPGLAPAERPPRRALAQYTCSASELTHDREPCVRLATS